MSGWEFFGRVVAWLMAWPIAGMLLSALWAMIGDWWMLLLYMTVAHAAIGYGLGYLLIVRGKR